VIVHVRVPQTSETRVRRPSFRYKPFVGDASAGQRWVRVSSCRRAVTPSKMLTEAEQPLIPEIDQDAQGFGG